MEDRRNVLADTRPYSYKVIGGDTALVFHSGKRVFTAVGKDYRRLQSAIETNDEYLVQLALAKMTGNFKRRNERK